MAQKLQPILVAGKAGQLARSLESLSIERKLALIAIGRPTFDLCDAERVDQIVANYKPAAIVNAAAYTSVDKAESESDLAFSINRDGAAHLAAAAGRLGIPFVQISTDYVFDGQKSTPYREDDATAPLGIYGRSKREGEIAVLERYPSAVILRTSWVYSPFGQNFVKTMLRLAATRDKVRVVNDQYGTPTFARDIAKAILEILDQINERRQARLAGIYHLSANGFTTWHGFAQAIFASWRKRGRTVPILEAIPSSEYPTPAQRPANSRLDCSKAERAFGLRLPVWQKGLEACLDELATAEGESPKC